MAKQQGLLRLIGTIGAITFYKLNGKYYARKKSSLTARQVKTAPAFESTRIYARNMAVASKAAKALYRLLPEEYRDVTIYRRMVGEALKMLNRHITEDQLEGRLKTLCLPQVYGGNEDK